MFEKKFRVLIYIVPIFSFIFASLIAAPNMNLLALEKSKAEEMNHIIMPEIIEKKEPLYVKTLNELNIEEATSLIKENSKEIIKTEAEETELKVVKTTKKKQRNKKVQLTAKQKEVLKAGNKKISGYSQIFGDVKNISIIDYLNKVCDYFEENSEIEIELDAGMFLALLYQESRCLIDIKDGIAQITISEDAKYSLKHKEISISTNNTRNPIESIDWTIVSFLDKYSTLLGYRTSVNPKASISQWYVLKIHNTGASLQQLRYNYIGSFELTAEGDDLFVETYESFGTLGKRMFKEYLNITKNSKAIIIANKINSSTTYKDYTSFDFLFSDPKYIENIKQFYIKDVG